jgi:hypothetical protein
VLTGQAKVMDISKNGAKIVLGVPSQVPQRFELAFLQDATKRQACEVIRRRGKMIGVQSQLRSLVSKATPPSIAMTSFALSSDVRIPGACIRDGGPSGDRSDDATCIRDRALRSR